MTYRVLVTDEVALSGLGPLVDDDSFVVRAVADSASDEFMAELGSADALILRSATRVSSDMISRAPRLMVIGRAGVGIDNVDIPAASERGIAVFNAPEANTIAAAELTLALMISVARKIPAAESSLRRGEWDRASFRGVELRGKVLGLIGAGRIGSEVAVRGRAFGMEVVACDPYLSRARADELRVEMVDLDEILERADFVSIHVPLTAETRGILGTKALEQMKPTAYLVNASRGGVVDEVALAAALHSGDISGAALDVYESEPLAHDSPLRGAPNLVLTPHLGASTAEAQLGVATVVAEKIRILLQTGSFTDAVNAADLG
ncbi:MAG TPA: hydroxyacid dehydrogenase [Acidimicrobiia bacterium]|nr:hydroxyacid dehydrogenase [Acidimicrobiia bacterium]